MYKIGIVGKGFVGSAVQNGFSPNVGCDTEVRVFDVDPTRSLNTLEETVNKSDFVFISVPTPSKKNGKISLDILMEALSMISAISTNFNTIFLVRSTVTPGTTENLQNIYDGLRLVFNPEFLTERSATFDFINQTRFILGGHWSNTDRVADLYRWRFGKTVSILKTNFQTAEMIKYMNNTFFATKISFLNEMYLLANECGVKWSDAVEGFVRDGRIGHSHMNVPGHDGKFGFGGSCFPKDIQAIINFGDSMGVDMKVLKGAWETNLKVRPEKDWEELKGRAVVNG